MKKKKKNLVTLEELKDQHFGKRGTPKRNDLEEAYQNFKLGVLLQEARLKKGMTQQELADKVGTTILYFQDRK